MPSAGRGPWAGFLPAAGSGPARLAAPETAAQPARPGPLRENGAKEDFTRRFVEMTEKRELEIAGVHHISIKARGLEQMEKTVDFYHNILNMVRITQSVT